MTKKSALERSQIPGWILLVIIGFASTKLSLLVELGGKHPLEASAIAIIIGVLIRNVFGIPKICSAGVLTGEKLLIAGVVLLGASLDFASIEAQGPKLLCVVLLTMVVAFFLIVALGRAFSLSPALTILLAVGTTICGTSAIAITAPLIKAKEEETSYSVATVALWGLIAILIYPKIGQMLGLSDFTFGVFAGTAIHSTPQVVGAGYIFSDAAGQLATAVKLVRNCFMAPLALLIAIYWSKRTGAAERVKVDVKNAFPWFLFGYFILAWCSTQGYFTKTGIDGFTEAGKFLVLLGMAAVGLTTSVASFKAVGSKPLIVGLISSIVLAGVSAAAIALIL